MTAPGQFLLALDSSSRFVRGVGDPQCHKLTPEACEDYFVDEALSKLPTSYNKDRARVLLFLAFCTRRGWLTGDPMAEVGRRKTQARRPRLQLTASQLRAMIETSANPRDRAMLAAGANLGLRASDLVGLKVGDVDLDSGSIRVVIQKTQDADLLPITSDLDRELRTWLQWYSERLAAQGRSLDSDAHLFPPLRRNVRIKRNIVPFDPEPEKQLRHPARVVHRGLERIGVETQPGEGFHTLRRSIARVVFEQAANEGHDGALRMAASLLGHKSVQTTELYLGIDRDRMKRDAMLRGRSILGAPVAGNVVRLEMGS